MTRAKIDPISAAIPAARQDDARHYGVHPYFTRRPANVVRAYIERYSREGDTVLDPFGGTGVTAIEAFLLGRKAIHNDLNPFANFIASCIANTTLKSTEPLREAFERVCTSSAKPLNEIEASEAAAAQWLNRLQLPANIRLPRTSDAEFFYDLFTPRQLAGLAVLKQNIEDEPAGIIRDLLLLAWSASVAKLNKTFLSAKGRAASRGGSSIFSIYRYKLASAFVELPIWETFKGRFQNVLAAKKEVLLIKSYREQTCPKFRRLDSRRDFRVLDADAATLDQEIRSGTVDYIFTDPPYGAFINYLDLSILWNHWLGFQVSEEAAENEIIVGGERGHTEEHYKERLAISIQTALRLLRPDRWMSIVFQHWDVSYFETILETAESNGAALKAAITQTGDVIWSMHKKKNSASVLAGEFILTFYKPKNAPERQSRPPARRPTSEITLSEAFDECLANGAGSFTSEALFNRLVIELWRRRALSCLSLDRRTFAQNLEQRGWRYNPKTHIWATSNGDSRPASTVNSLFEE
ncbi:MAG TPA: DNA methyltransferase [Gemmataceae bacterium]|jgi:adenine-specific DNA methylase|nr:DNA methyltransferase [Gemmataceae bacterium]